MADRRRDEEDERPRRERDRGEERGSRREERDDDRGSRRSPRDEDERGSRSRREEEDEPRRSRRDEDERGGGGSDYRYERRDPEATRRRAEDGGRDFDRLVKEGIKQFRPNDGDNRIRLMPPTWPKADHYGFDVKVHYGVGAERGSYLCLCGMKGEDDPIYEAYERARVELNEDEENKSLQELVRNLKAKNRTAVFLIDRDHEKEGVQFWAMPQSLDNDIVQVMQDKSTGEVLPIDDPKAGYDVEFRKTGKARNTEYSGVAIARRSTPLASRQSDADKWMEFAVKNPIPDILVYYPYDHIAKAFGGGGSRRRDEGDDRRERDDRASGRRDRMEREERDDRGRERTEREEPRRSREEERPAGRTKEGPTWESIHDMTKTELVDLIEEEKLDIKPKDAKDVDDLADWVCEEMKIKKPREERRPARDAGEGEDKLAEMRRRREERD